MNFVLKHDPILDTWLIYEKGEKEARNKDINVIVSFLADGSKRSASFTIISRTAKFNSSNALKKLATHTTADFLYQIGKERSIVRGKLKLSIALQPY